MSVSEWAIVGRHFEKRWLLQFDGVRLTISADLVGFRSFFPFFVISPSLYLYPFFSNLCYLLAMMFLLVSSFSLLFFLENPNNCISNVNQANRHTCTNTLIWVQDVTKITHKQREIENGKIERKRHKVNNIMKRTYTHLNATKKKSSLSKCWQLKRTTPESNDDGDNKWLNTYETEKKKLIVNVNRCEFRLLNIFLFCFVVAAVFSRGSYSIFIIRFIVLIRFQCAISWKRESSIGSLSHYHNSVHLFDCIPLLYALALFLSSIVDECVNAHFFFVLTLNIEIRRTPKATPSAIWLRSSSRIQINMPAKISHTTKPNELHSRE